MLAELGNLPLFNTTREQRENIEVIIQAAERMADVRIGAIIAIQQSIQLQDVVESGIVVDCEATPEMLETIFFPNNAIHDGGVILIGDRIAFAACIFPLTQRQVAQLGKHAPQLRLKNDERGEGGRGEERLEQEREDFELKQVGKEREPQHDKKANHHRPAAGAPDEDQNIVDGYG